MTVVAVLAMARATMALIEPEMMLRDEFMLRDEDEAEDEEEWRKARLPSGREYLWRHSDSGDVDDPDIVLLDKWRVGTTSKGRRYLWRENADNPEDPEVKFWSESTLNSGAPFWYAEDGEISLTDPFAAAVGVA